MSLGSRIPVALALLTSVTSASAGDNAFPNSPQPLQVAGAAGPLDPSCYSVSLQRFDGTPVANLGAGAPKRKITAGSEDELNDLYLAVQVQAAVAGGPAASCPPAGDAHVVVTYRDPTGSGKIVTSATDVSLQASMAQVDRRQFRAAFTATHDAAAVRPGAYNVVLGISVEAGTDPNKKKWASADTPVSVYYNPLWKYEFVAHGTWLAGGVRNCDSGGVCNKVYPVVLASPLAFHIRRAWSDTSPTWGTGLTVVITGAGATLSDREKSASVLYGALLLHVFEFSVPALNSDIGIGGGMAWSLSTSPTWVFGISTATNVASLR